MIHVTEEKRLNDFKEVRCVKPRDLFMRFGKRESIPFDSNLEEQIPMNMNKLDSIEYLERYDECMQTLSESAQNQQLQNNDSASISDNEG